MMGSLMGIARAVVKRAPLIPVDTVAVTVESGIDGDARGKKTARQVTVLFQEAWEAACKELAVDLPWVTRRANLLVAGMPTPKEGETMTIGTLVLQVTGETHPCHLMDAAHLGLKRALTPQWRGGVCCRVLRGGTIYVGDRVERA